jgi:hypothetical protein
MDRRQFVKGAASAIVITPALLQLGACGDDESTAADGGGATAGTGGNTSGTGAGTNGAAGTTNAGTGGLDKDASALADGAIGEDGGSLPGDGGGNPGTPTDGGLDASTDASDQDTSVANLCPSGANDTNITDNHGHSLSISKEDVDAGAQKTYSIEGLADHPHSITLMVAHFTMLKAGNSVTVTSFSGGHSHDVTVDCV